MVDGTILLGEFLDCRRSLILTGLFKGTNEQKENQEPLMSLTDTCICFWLYLHQYTYIFLLKPNLRSSRKTQIFDELGFEREVPSSPEQVPQYALTLKTRVELRYRFLTIQCANPHHHAPAGKANRLFDVIQEQRRHWTNLVEVGTRARAHSHTHMRACMPSCRIIGLS